MKRETEDRIITTLAVSAALAMIALLASASIMMVLRCIKEYKGMY